MRSEHIKSWHDFTAKTQRRKEILVLLRVLEAQWP